MVTVPVHDLNAGLELVQSSLNKKIPVTDGGRGLNLFYLLSWWLPAQSYHKSMSV